MIKNKLVRKLVRYYNHIIRKQYKVHRLIINYNHFIIKQYNIGKILTVLHPKYHCEKQKIMDAVFMKSAKTPQTELEITNDLYHSLLVASNPRVVLDLLYTYLDDGAEGNND